MVEVVVGLDVVVGVVVGVGVVEVVVVGVGVVEVVVDTGVVVDVMFGRDVVVNKRRVSGLVPRRPEGYCHCNTEDGVDFRVPCHEAIVGCLDLNDLFTVTVFDRGRPDGFRRPLKTRATSSLQPRATRRGKTWWK